MILSDWLNIYIASNDCGANTRHRSNAGLMLGHRLRRLPIIKTAPDECLVFALWPHRYDGIRRVRRDTIRTEQAQSQRLIPTSHTSPVYSQQPQHIPTRQGQTHKLKRGPGSD